MAAVELVGVSKVFGGRVAVRELSLNVDDGELVSIVGPSGCGKTTTLRIIAGLETPTGGEIRIDGRRVNDLPPADRDVAMVFQNDALYPHMTVRQNLEFGLTLRGVARADVARRVADAAASLALGELLERKPAGLSGGERQRVALGRALVRQPAAFLFDEPLSNLDARVRSELRELIAALHRRRRATMIYVTHDHGEALALGERVAVMSAGAVLQAAAPREIYRRPACRFVAGFIGSPPMSFWRGAIGDDGALRLPSGRIELAATTRGPAVLGVRPEDIVRDGEGPRMGRVAIDAVESLGRESWAWFELGGVRAAMCGAGLAAGATVEPRIRAGAWMLFADDARGARVEG
jgi:multiple sugar transport system ATP-binding protein